MKPMRFQIDSRSAQDTPPVAGTATRGDNDDMRVMLTKPSADAGLRPRGPVPHSAH